MSSFNAYRYDDTEKDENQHLAAPTGSTRQHRMTVDLPSPLADAGVVSVGGKQESQESRPQDLPYGQSFPAVPFSSHAEQHRAVAQTQYMYNQLQQMHYAQLGMMPMPHGMQFAMGPHDAQPQQQQQQQPMPQQLQQQPQRASEPSKESAGPAVAPLRASVPPIVSWPQAHSVTPATDIDLPAATSTAPLSISPPATAATDDVHEATPVPTSVDTPMADPVETLRAKVTALMPQVEPLDIKPDHYYGSTEDGVGVPVFKPTYEEFRDFYRFMKAIDKYGMESGIVKVVPPKEWRESLPPIDPRKLSDVQIRCAIKQQISGSGMCGFRCVSDVNNVLMNARILIIARKIHRDQHADTAPTQCQAMEGSLYTARESNTYF